MIQPISNLLRFTRTTCIWVPWKISPWITSPNEAGQLLTMSANRRARTQTSGRIETRRPIYLSRHHLIHLLQA